MHWPVELILFVFLIGVGVVVARMKDLFAAAMLTGMFSLISAGLYTSMDAVDVAFTEAAVGAGFSTVLFLGTLALTSTTERQQGIRWLPFAVVVMVGAALIYGTLDMPHYGDPNAIIHAPGTVSAHYIERTVPDFHIPNMVTAVLASWRGYDTFGETTVIFTAALGVWLMLGGRREDDDEGVVLTEAPVARDEEMPAPDMDATLNEYADDESPVAPSDEVGA